MTKEQLEALEDWIIAIVHDEAPASDVSDWLNRRAAKEAVVKAIAIETGKHLK